MSFDFSSLIWIVILVMFLQPLLTGRWSAMQRASAIRAIEQAHDSQCAVDLIESKCRTAAPVSNSPIRSNSRASILACAVATP